MFEVLISPLVISSFLSAFICVYLFSSAVKNQPLIPTDKFSHHSYTTDATRHDIT